MKKRPIYIGIKNSVKNSVEDGVCELYFMDTIQDSQSYDWFSGEIEEESLLADVIEQVNACNAKKIIQYNNSWGGSADVGLGIYNYLKNHPAKKETKILNHCASIATVMAFSGDKGKITMPRNGFYVIHEASNAAQGRSKDLREAADLCDTYTENILDVYVQNNRVGMTRDAIHDLIKDGDCWMTGTQAKEMGFVDDTYNDDSVTVTACINSAKKIYNNIPAHILALTDETETEQEPEKISQSILNKIGMDIKALVDAAMNKLKGTTADAKGSVTEQITASLEPVLTEMATGIEAQVTAEINTAKEAVTAQVTEATKAIEDKYKGIIDDLKKTVTDLQADVTTLQGGETPVKPDTENKVQFGSFRNSKKG